MSIPKPKSRMERMKCGACGRATARVYAARDADDRRAFLAIEVRCRCGVRTRLTVRPAAIVQDTNETTGSAGSHCVGWGSR